MFSFDSSCKNTLTALSPTKTVSQTRWQINGLKANEASPKVSWGRLFLITFPLLFLILVNFIPHSCWSSCQSSRACLQPFRHFLFPVLRNLISFTSLKPLTFVCSNLLLRFYLHYTPLQGGCCKTINSTSPSPTHQASTTSSCLNTENSIYRLK